MTDDQRSPPGDSFLARRARLKAERQRAARESASPAEQAPDAANETTETAEATASPPAPALTDADMPPVESLTAESDFTMFLSEGVSDALRRTALRKLFHLPEFNILDGLNDYDEDYTKFEKLGDVVTYHQRSMLAREEAAKKAAAEQEAAEQEAAEQEAAEQEAAEMEAGELSDPAGEEEEAVSSRDTPVNEVVAARDGVGAAQSRDSVPVADGEEVEDDGDLES
jgi:hypothetical protein